MNKLETFYGNKNIQSTPSLQSPTRFVLEIKYIFDKEKEVFSFKRPYEPDEHPDDHSDTRPYKDASFTIN